VRRALALVALTGCSQILGLEDFHKVDAPPPEPDARTAKLQGRVYENQGGFVIGATVAWFVLPDRTQFGQTTSGNTGDYSLDVPVDTDGYMFVAAAGDDNTQQYLGAPVTADRAQTAFLFTPAYINQLAAHASLTQNVSTGFVLLQIRDGSGSGLAGATATCSSGMLVYNGPNGPEPTMTATDAGGIVTVFNVAPGTQTVTATFGTTTVTRMVIVVGASMTLATMIVQ
jgi:hypothetical protein